MPWEELNVKVTSKKKPTKASENEEEGWGDADMADKVEDEV